MMVENKQRLAMVSRIVKLVRLQEALIRRFDKLLETSLLDSVTIADFLTNQDWKLNEDIHDLVTAFLDAFNHSRTDLFIT